MASLCPTQMFCGCHISKSALCRSSDVIANIWAFDCWCKTAVLTSPVRVWMDTQQASKKAAHHAIQYEITLWSKIMQSELRNEGRHLDVWGSVKGHFSARVQSSSSHSKNLSGLFVPIIRFTCVIWKDLCVYTSKITVIEEDLRNYLQIKEINWLYLNDIAPTDKHCTVCCEFTEL